MNTTYCWSISLEFLVSNEGCQWCFDLINGVFGGLNGYLERCNRFCLIHLGSTAQIPIIRNSIRVRVCWYIKWILSLEMLWLLTIWYIATMMSVLPRPVIWYFHQIFVSRSLPRSSFQTQVSFTLLNMSLERLLGYKPNELKPNIYSCKEILLVV